MRLLLTKRKGAYPVKRILTLLLAAAVTAATAFFLPEYGVLDRLFAAPVIAETEATPHVGFSTGTLFEDSCELIVPAAEAAAWETDASQYRSSLHYDTLTAAEQQVYRALEYAMEAGQTNVLVDKLLVEDYQRLEEILFFLAYDSPLLEQNLRYEVGDFTTYHDVEVLSVFRRSADFEGYYLTVDNFAPQWWEKKQLAIDEAEKVVAALDSTLSPIDKAEALYRHVAGTVTYADYGDDDAVHPYLYDALVTGRTHCDGYTNALALLLRLAGIENAEKDYAPADTEEVGHTWNCMEIGGKWYNADAVGGDLIPVEQSAMHAGYYFAFADELLEYGAGNGHIFPACEESYYMPVDGRLKRSSDSGLPGAVIRGYGKHGGQWALVIIDDYTERHMDTQLQTVADRLQATVYWLSFPLHSGSTALLVYDGALYGE